MLKFEDIRVIVINKETLDKGIDESVKEELAKCVGSALAPQLEKGESFRTRSVKWAIIEGTNILTDNECIFNEVTNKGIKLDIFSEFEPDENGHKKFSVLPRFSATLSLEDLKEHATETMDLITFMADRYNYNPRIENNQSRLLFKLKNLT